MPEMKSLLTKPRKFPEFDPNRPQFPRLHLSGDEVSSLGLDGASLNEERVLTLKARISSVSNSDDDEMGSHKSVTLELEEGSSELASASPTAAEVLFGG